MMSEDNIEIRLANIEDISKIVTLVRNSFNENYLVASIYKCQGIDKFIASELENLYSPYKYYVAEINHIIVAFVEFKLFYDSSVAFLNMIATDNNFKGRGIANKIFNYTKIKFSNLGFDNIQLDVFGSNKIAESWYLSLGFKLEESKVLYKYNFTQSSNFLLEEEFIISNYPSFKHLHDHFKFSFLQLTFKKQNLNIGVIDENVILRDKLVDSDSYGNLYMFLKKQGIKELYYIGKESLNKDFVKIDEINRMKFIFLYGNN